MTFFSLVEKINMSTTRQNAKQAPISWIITSNHLGRRTFEVPAFFSQRKEQCLVYKSVDQTPERWGRVADEPLTNCQPTTNAVPSSLNEQLKRAICPYADGKAGAPRGDRRITTLKDMREAQRHTRPKTLHVLKEEVQEWLRREVEKEGRGWSEEQKNKGISVWVTYVKIQYRKTGKIKWKTV